MKKQIFFVCLIFGLFLTGFVDSDMTNSSVGVDYDSKIGDLFDNQTLVEQVMENIDLELLEISDGQIWIKVLVELKDYSGIVVTGTKEERKILSRQKDEWFSQAIDEFFSTLSENERQNLKKDSIGFDGKITKNTFNKLVQEDRIKAIFMDMIVSSVMGKIQMLEEVTMPKQKKNLFWIWAVLGVLVLVILYLIIKRKR